LLRSVSRVRPCLSTDDPDVPPVGAAAASASSPLTPAKSCGTSKPQPDGPLVKALARAWRWQKLLDKGVYISVQEIADAERINKSYVSRILRLALLAPDIVEAILGGWADQSLILERLERPLPASWEEQREQGLGIGR
jgi:hypothetical protein